MPAALDPAVAEARSRAKGWIPWTIFPGAEKRWPGHCAICMTPGAVFYRNFCSPKSTQGPCRPCTGLLKKTEEEARAIFARRGLMPTRSYQGYNEPWESVCGNCLQITSPTLASVTKAIRQGQPKCCDRCRRNGPITPEIAEDILRSAGAAPIKQYPGVKEPWLARCLNEECRREIEPALDSIKNAGTGACRHCGGYGIKSDDEALLYLMTHADYNAAKIGIAKVGSKRIAHHEGVGWSLASTTTLRGREARFIEDAVLACWKALNLPYGVPPTHMPYAGYTETVSLALRSLDAIREDIARAIARAERQ